ncbi:putative secreted protein [Corynebacterium jeikeium K411]|uniref:Putative secreted protein n=1 Tax=Corynebacterium jeikeium (strain K411) TaxID=306537 RepID=Q4JY50_CORJK|nr:putative secreted protein [Corynebacterium jeikeium K411]
MPKLGRHKVKRASLALVAGIALAFSASACGSTETDEPTSETSAERTVDPVKGTELPIDAAPEPVGQGGQEVCPYLDGEWLQNTNGQRLTGTGTDERFDPPACVFWSYEDYPQATVMVRHMRTNSDAIAVVDHAAPIDSTLKALEPEGWSGGRRGGDGQSGAVYAVWKDETAVVVTTAQEQSVKAQKIAEETIKNLKL